jgi:mRNA interferase MazF
MEKDFAKWHSLKEKLQQKSSEFIFGAGEIWLCALGLNLGHEEDGKGDVFLRPIVIFKKINSDTFWAIPLTSQKKIGSHYYSFDFNGRENVAIISQIRILDRRRLWRKKGIMSTTQFSLMVVMFKKLLP